MVFDYKTIKMMISKKIPIIEINLGENIKGLYYSDHIIINKDLDDIQKACTLLELF